MDTLLTSAVRLGDGRTTAITGLCRQLRLRLGGLEFHIDRYVFKLGSVDVILGVSWLATLGVVRANWQQLNMIICDREVTLQGETKFVRRGISLKPMVKLTNIPGEWFVWVRHTAEEMELATTTLNKAAGLVQVTS